MVPSRRAVLRTGLFGTALLLVGGAGLGLSSSTVRNPPPGLKVLSARMWTVLDALSDVMCPGGEGRPAASELGVAALLDTQLSTMHPADAADFGRVLLLLDNALVGLLFDGRPRHFADAPPDVQAQILASWRDSRLLVRRQAYKALRGLVMATYWAQPGTYAWSGYPGPPDFGQARAPADDFDALAAEGELRCMGRAEGLPPDRLPPGEGTPPGQQPEAPDALQEAP